MTFSPTEGSKHTNYHSASDLLNRSHPLDPCYAAASKAASLVAEAWDVLSDPDRKASLDSRFEALQQEPQLTPPPPPQPSAPPTAQAGQEDMGRGKRKRSVPVNSPPAATTTPSVVAHGRRAGLRVRKRNV